MKTEILKSDKKQSILKKALLIRHTEATLLELFQKGEIHGTIHTCIGQELTGAVISEHLRPEDAVFSSHRGHGHFLAATGDGLGLVAELMGKETGVCRGRGGSQHLHRKNFFTSGVQGNIVPVAAGFALSLKRRGEGGIAVVFLGDGTLGQGVIYETLNLASVLSLPILFVLENNSYAQSTPTAQTTAGPILARPEAFGIESAKADTWDFEGLYGISGRLVEKVRTRCAPAFLQVDTYRLKAHSKGDDDRPREEIAAFEAKDPLNLFLQDSPAEAQAMLGPIDAEISRWVSAARTAPAASADASAAARSGGLEWRKIPPGGTRMGQALNQAFRELLENKEVLFIGEDVCDPYGGAFKISKGLSTLFPERVLNMPISEAAITGLGAGLALGGWRPIVEIMFGDFLTLAADQIVNGLSKFEMYPGLKAPNLVIRAPMGGYRGYGPTHSQSLERMFFGFSGLSVVALNNFLPPKDVYRRLLDFGPVLCIENKAAYTKSCPLAIQEGFQALASSEPLPTIWIRPDSSHVNVTILTYGGMADLALQAADRLFEDHDLICQVLCPTLIHPFRLNAFCEILRAGALVATLEEGPGFAGFGAEIAAQLAECKELDGLGFVRSYAAAATIPASRVLEEAVLPSLDGVVERIVKCARERNL